MHKLKSQYGQASERHILRVLRATGLDREDGQILPLFAFAIVALIAMTGVVVDGGNLFQKRQSLQNAADASAVAAAVYITDPTKTCGVGDPIGVCTGKYAGLNGAKDAAGNVVTQLAPCPNTVTDTKAPSTPPGCYVYPYNGAGKVEVWLTQRTSNFFGGILGIGVTTESARAVGTVTTGNPPPIAFAALDDSCDNHTLLIKLGGNLRVNSGIYVNSCDDHDGFDIFGAGSLSATAIKVHGGWETHGGSHVCVVGAPLVPCASNSPDLCKFPRNNKTDWKIFWNPTTAGYLPTRLGCPDIGQDLLLDPFAGFPPPPDLGAGNVGPPVSITKVSRGLNGDAANVARVVTAAAHGLSFGDKVSISGVGIFGGGDFDGTYTVTSVPNGTTFTYANTGAKVPAIVQKQMSGGVATLTTNAPTTLFLGESDLFVSSLLGFNASGATVTGTGATSFSYSPPPFSVGITRKQLLSGTATLTATSTAGLDPGDTVTIAGVGSPFDGSRTVETVPNGTTTFTYANSATNTLTVTQKAAAHGVATLTAANNLKAGNSVTVNIGDPRFDGTYTVSAATGTQFSYADSNLGTMPVNATVKVMAAGVATITTAAAHRLLALETVTVKIGDVNYDGGPYTVTNVPNGTTFKYTPAVPVSLTSGLIGAITGGVATVRTGAVDHKLAANDDVKVSGDEAYAFTGNASNVGVPSATSFTYRPTPIANVVWDVTSATSATFTTPGIHDTNITSITITGTGKAYLNKTWTTGTGLTVSPNRFTITGAGFNPADQGNAATVTVNTASSTTFSGALATAETAWNLASKTASGTVTVPYFLAATATSGTVTAPGFVAATAVSPVGSALLTDVPLLDASGGLFTPAWMSTFGVLAENFPGSPGIPSPYVISTGERVLKPGTYYGGICIGVAAGSNCASAAAMCKAAAGSTTTVQSYQPVVTLAVDVADAATTGLDTTIKLTPPGVVRKGDVLAIGDEELKVTGDPVGVNVPVTREWNRYEGDAYPAGTEVKQVVTTPNGAPYNPVEKLDVSIDGTATSFTVKASANPSAAQAIRAGDVIQIGGEAMLVSSVSSYNATTRVATVTISSTPPGRGYYNTTPTDHSSGDQIYKVTAAGTPPPPTVRLEEGIYIMAGGGFGVCGAASLIAPDVMIYNTDNPTNLTGFGKLGQVNINTSGKVRLGPMNSGIYAGMTIFQDRLKTLVPGTACGGKSNDPRQWDIALQSAAPLPASGALGSISGTIYAPNLRSLFGDTMSGTANLAVITSCIYINGANSTFNHDGSGGGLFGVSATLGG